MKRSMILIIGLLLLGATVQAQCESSFGTIVISEIYFDTRYNEKINSKYHSFGEYIELFNSSDTPIDLHGWVIKDNHTSFTITSGYMDNNTIIAPGGFKVITFNCYYGGGSNGVPSAIGGRQKFKELFGFSEDYPDADIILQDRMVLYNDIDIVRVYGPSNKLIDEISYLNGSTSKPNPKTFLGISDYNIHLEPKIYNDSGGFFNGPIGVYSVYIPYPVNATIEIETTEFSNTIYRSEVADYYSDGGTTIGRSIASPLAFPPGLSVPLKPIDPFLHYLPLDSNAFNSTASISFDVKTGLEDGNKKTYFNDFGKPTVSISKDYKNSLFWGMETAYDSFGRESMSSFMAPSCFEMQKVNFLTNSIIRDRFVARYYGDANPYEEYQAAAEKPWSEIIYDKLNPGNIVNIVEGNRVTEGGQQVWKTGYSFTIPAAQEMYYVYGKDYYNGIIDSNGEEVITNFDKTIVIDANGIENVSFSDGEGNTLATARSGGTNLYPVKSVIGTQGYIDIHIPSGSANGVIFGFSSTNDYKVFDLKTGYPITPTPATLAPANIYRIVANTSPSVDPKVYITGSGGVVTSPGALGVAYNVNYYDYAVNIYNKTGQLVKKVQPKGFLLHNPIAAQPVYMSLTAVDYISKYNYNTLGQLNEKTSPDEGISKIVYRKDGQVRYSQSSIQADTKVSYTNYDDYARPTESGVISGTNGIWNIAKVNADIATNIPGTKSELTFNIYDYAENYNNFPPAIITALNMHALPAGYIQRFLASNVALTLKSDNGSAIDAITWFSYDIYGRTEWVIQYNPVIGKKTIDYEYDHKGNVSKIIFQKNNISEKFTHRYTYDVNNDLTTVETARGNNAFTIDAQYDYYKTGELKRTNVAQGAQGLDYVYTLGGMLKSINHPSLSQSKDPGNDLNDFFGITLDYYQGDYKRLNYQGLNNFETAASTGNDYAGNIKAVRWANKNSSMDWNGSSVAQKGYLYNYNRDNWLNSASFGNANAFGNISAIPNKLQEKAIQYDANGNITHLQRTNKNAVLVDNIAYSYNSTVPKNNRLLLLNDTAPNPSDPTAFNPLLNGTIVYSYNALGQLTHDSEQNLNYEYNAQGLVKEVKQNGLPKVKFYYNERGQRIRKESFSPSANDYYLLDPSGNVMSIYTENNTSPLAQTEMPIYGISRLGIFNKGVGVNPDVRNYQIADHLGNIRAVIRKISGSPYAAMMSYADYYPFGEQLDGRNSNNGNYRYAFQGQELDGETGKEAFQLRLWDGRIGRWITPDPKGQYLSPYLGMGNNPVSMTDPDGGFAAPPNDYFTDSKTGKTTVVLTNDNFDRFFVDGVLSSQVLKTASAPEVSKLNITRTVDMFKSMSSLKIPYVSTNNKTIGIFTFDERADTQISSTTGKTKFGNVATGNYVSLNNDYKWLSWYQTISQTGGSRSGERVDSTADSHPYYPVLVSPEKGFDKTFYDFANSTNNNNDNITWKAELSLVGVHKGTGEVTRLFTYGWGYYITSKNSYGPLPNSGMVKPSAFHLNNLK